MGVMKSMREEPESHRPSSERPDRVELFGFYFLGIHPNGDYKFANSHQVAQHYKVTPQQVMIWLKQMDLAPRSILDRQFRLGEAQADLMMDSPHLNGPELRHRLEEILAEVDDAPGGWRFWEER
jgi:hypothetical protein